MDTGYRLIEHTADAGLIAWGRSPGSAFAAAARGMFAIILGAEPGEWVGEGRPATVSVTASGQDWPELLVNWLVELLVRFEVDALAPVSISVERCEPPRCAAEVEGLELADADAVEGVGVKAVTYHQIRVDVSPHRTELHVIFDI